MGFTVSSPPPPPPDGQYSWTLTQVIKNLIAQMFGLFPSFQIYLLPLSNGDYLLSPSLRWSRSLEQPFVRGPWGLAGTSPHSLGSLWSMGTVALSKRVTLELFKIKTIVLFKLTVNFMAYRLILSWSTFKRKIKFNHCPAPQNALLYFLNLSFCDTAPFPHLMSVSGRFRGKTPPL